MNTLVCNRSEKVNAVMRSSWVDSFYWILDSPSTVLTHIWPIIDLLPHAEIPFHCHPSVNHYIEYWKNALHCPWEPESELPQVLLSLSDHTAENVQWRATEQEKHLFYLTNKMLTCCVSHGSWSHCSCIPVFTAATESVCVCPVRQLAVANITLLVFIL